MAKETKMIGSSNVLMFRAAFNCGVNYAPANDNEKETDIKTVTVRKTLEKSGDVTKIKVPVSQYYGIAVVTIISDNGVLSSEIELLHKDEDLNYKVFREEGNQNVVAEWQNWGKKLRLPLFIRAGDNGLMPYSQKVGGVMVGNNSERKKAVGESNRRPHFLNRRKPG